jgi:uncharacterized membrane protein YccC
MAILASLLGIGSRRPRWPVALRAAGCTGLAVAAGWAAGDVSLGMLATIGTFASVYASERPYLNRAAVLAGVALSLALVVVVGLETQHLPWIAVPVVAVIALTATFVCNSLRIGPPGAYLIVLACAAGTSLPLAPHNVGQVAAIVLAGGGLSWIVHMAGAVVAPRRPERAAVAVAAAAVAGFAEAAGSPREEAARHAAALALHDAWATLVTFQPGLRRRDGVLAALRKLNRDLHVLFANGIEHRPDADATATAAQARRIGTAAKTVRAPGSGAPLAAIPLGHLGIGQTIRENLGVWSQASTAALRVAVATLLAGALGAVLGVERIYWIMAAAVLIVHQGLGWSRALRRGVERMLGTLGGLGVAAILLALQPIGPWLVATLVILQFTIETLVVRSYALAVVFITAIALVIASGGQAAVHPAELLWVRGVDTFAGCLVGLFVHLVVSPRSPATSLRQEIDRTVAAVRQTLSHLSAGAVTSLDARRDRRYLQHRIFVLANTYEVEAAARSRRRAAAEAIWPAVAATQRLGYRTLAACWAMEENEQDAPQEAVALAAELDAFAARED